MKLFLGAAGCRPLFSGGAVFCMLVLGAFVFAGCTASNAQSQTGYVADKLVSSSKSSSSLSKDAPASSVSAETKTGTQKVQDSIALALEDGRYSGNETYAYHSGTETVTFSLSVKDDVVTEVSVTPHDPNPMSARIIGKMAAALPDVIVGKKITELNLPHNIAGSSLTTAAFGQFVQGLLDKNAGKASAA